MAQTSYTPISLYYSTTASATPTAGNLVNGELAININDGKLFYKDSSGVVQTIASKGTGTIGGSTTQVQYNSSGAFAGSANMTFDGTSLSLTNQLNLTNASNYNLYASGAGANYMAGSLGIGTTSITGYSLRVSKNLTGTTSAWGVTSEPAVLSDVTGTVVVFGTAPSTQAASFTLGELRHYDAAAGTVGAGSTITSQYGFFARATLTGATNNYAFTGGLAAATGRFNLYMSGTANNYLAGALGIGATSLTGYTLRVSKNITGGGFSYGIWNDSTVQSDVTSFSVGITSILSTQAATFTTNINQFLAKQGTFGAGSTVTNQVGFGVDSNLTGATNNYGFRGSIAAATGRYNLYMDGTAANYFAGDMQFNKTVTAAGTTGAQTINKNAGTVNFAAAATSLVVTNNLVTTSSIIICTVGTNDLTMKSVQAVAGSGSFTIYANAAATAETRVNFIVIN